MTRRRKNFYKKNKSGNYILDNIPSEDELEKMAMYFTEICKERNCLGVCAVTSPVSNISHSGVYGDILSITYLLASLIERCAEWSPVKIEDFISTIALQSLGIAEGAFDKNYNKIDLKKYKNVFEKLQTSLKNIYDIRFKELENVTTK